MTTLVHTLITIKKALIVSGDTSVETSHDVHQELQLFEQRLESHINAAEGSAQRVKATLGLVS